MNVLGKACALATLVSTTGCSLVFVEEAPLRAEWPRYAASLEPKSPCTESPAPAIVDGAIAAGIITLGAAVWIEDRNPPANSENDVSAWLLALPALAAIVPLAISAIYGASATARCREYRRGPPYDETR